MDKIIEELMQQIDRLIILVSDSQNQIKRLLDIIEK